MYLIFGVGVVPPVVGVVGGVVGGVLPVQSMDLPEMIFWNVSTMGVLSNALAIRIVPAPSRATTKMVMTPPDGSQKIAIHFEDTYSGAISTHEYRADALYGMTREGFLPENIRTVFWIDFPSPANSRWMPTDNHVDYTREQLCAMIASMVKPFTPYWDKS